MNTRLVLPFVCVALLLSACGKNETASAAASEPAAGAATANAADAKAGARVIEITANDQMKFSITTIEAKAGEELKVVLENIGNLPIEAMGHNWVLLKPGTDVASFAAAAAAARTNEYIPPALADKVVAHTKLLGPKKTDSITFTVPAAGEYPFICSFPGHFVMMKGTLTAK